MKLNGKPVGDNMPLTVTEFAIMVAGMTAVLILTVLLNIRRRGLGWIFLGALIALLILGRVIEAVMM
jgi:hypothetical protein